jgi:superfamily II DNA or RNA helicase
MEQNPTPGRSVIKRPRNSQEFTGHSNTQPKLAPMHIPIEKYDQFTDLSDFGRTKVSDALLKAVRRLHEVKDLEEIVLRYLTDPNRTPHGPSEIVDILTLQLTYRKRTGAAGFILKGRSFTRISPVDISHQVFRLRQISDLTFAILGHTGNLLDPAREEFVRTAEDLGIDYTIIDATDFARLAVIQGALCPRDARRITDGRCRCGYRVRGDHLNFLQTEALKKLQETHDSGISKGVVVLPTGSGKTRIAAIDSKRQDARRILYLAHTHEILENAEREFAHIYGKKAVHRSWHCREVTTEQSVHLSTIQSISRSIGRIPSQQFDYIVIDEFHHAAANSYRSVISQLKPGFLLGLTATPFRADRQDVVELCGGNIVVEYELESGINSGILVPFHYYGCIDSKDVDYTEVKCLGGGYSIRDLNKVLIFPERDTAIIEKWCAMGQDLPTLAFCCSREHAKRMAASFVAAGIPAAEYLGTTPIERRLRLIEKLQYGQLKVLCAVDVLNEGVDIPFVECLLFLRPTESKRIFFQQLGRGLRHSPGKERVLVLDFIGNFHNAHRIPEYLGLHPEETVASESLERLKRGRPVISLPLGCIVKFDELVIDIFAQQACNLDRITRRNIHKILVLLYCRTSKSLGHMATRWDVETNQILRSEIYEIAFGSWADFIAIMKRGDYARFIK